MKLFLDSSALLAAYGGPTGASRYICETGQESGWTLLTSAYVVTEVEANLTALGPGAVSYWPRLRPQLCEVPVAAAFHWPSIFLASKDKPVLYTAAIHADVLLTLDRRDFADILGTSFYKLSIRTPADFLKDVAQLRGSETP